MSHSASHIEAYRIVHMDALDGEIDHDSGWISGWVTFFSTLSALLRESERTESPLNELRLRSLISEIEFRLSGLIDIVIFVFHHCTEDETQTDSEIMELFYKVESLVHSISSSVLPSLREKLERYSHNGEPTTSSRTLPGYFTEDQLRYLKTLIGFKWAQIAEIFGTSHMTLYRKRRELGLLNEERFSDISDSDLKDIVSSLKNKLPDCGERMVSGFLRAQGIFIPRCRLRIAIHEVDPINTSLRWHPRVLRRPYSVPGPMSLWHIG